MLSRLKMKGRPSSTSKGMRRKQGHKIIGTNNPITKGYDKMAHKAARHEGIIKEWYVEHVGSIDTTSAPVGPLKEAINALDVGVSNNMWDIALYHCRQLIKKELTTKVEPNLPTRAEWEPRETSHTLLDHLNKASNGQPTHNPIIWEAWCIWGRGMRQRTLPTWLQVPSLFTLTQ